MKRLVLDQGLPARAASKLRDAGWDAVHVRDIGMHESADLEILGYAAVDSRVVVTLDRDFPQILALTAATHPSVILIRQQRLGVHELLTLIQSIWREFEPDLDRGCVIKINARGAKVRPLPLR